MKNIAKVFCKNNRFALALTALIVGAILFLHIQYVTSWNYYFRVADHPYHVKTWEWMDHTTNIGNFSIQNLYGHGAGSGEIVEKFTNVFHDDRFVFSIASSFDYSNPSGSGYETHASNSLIAFLILILSGVVGVFSLLFWQRRASKDAARVFLLACAVALLCLWYIFVPLIYLNFTQPWAGGYFSG